MDKVEEGEQDMMTLAVLAADVVIAVLCAVGIVAIVRKKVTG